MAVLFILRKRIIPMKKIFILLLFLFSWKVNAQETVSLLSAKYSIYENNTDTSEKNFPKNMAVISCKLKIDSNLFDNDENIKQLKILITDLNKWQIKGTKDTNKIDINNIYWAPKIQDMVLIYCENIPEENLKITYNNSTIETIENYKTEFLIDSAKLIGAINKSSNKYETIIRCYIKNVEGKKENIIFLKNIDNWYVQNSEGKRIFLDSIECFINQPKQPALHGNFNKNDEYLISLKDSNKDFSTPLPVERKQIKSNSKWKFTNYKEMFFNFKRITNKKAVFAYDYGIESRIIEYELVNPFFVIPFSKKSYSSFSFDINSRGTLSENNEIRNGTTNKLGVYYNYYYRDYNKLDGLFKFGIFYFLETGMDTSEDKMFNVVNRSSSLSNIAFGISAEVPYSRFLNDEIHKITGYSRMAEPIRIQMNFFPKGNDLSEKETPSRNELTVGYELSLSSFFLLRGEFTRTFFNDATPNGLGKAEDYYSLTYAQDLYNLFGLTPFLKDFFGVKTEGNNFIYYTISSGKKPPLFKSLNEQSIGVSIMF
jgi:hypothetical protein